VFLLLAALRESWYTQPLVLLSKPLSAAFDAGAVICMRDYSNGIFVRIDTVQRFAERLHPSRGLSREPVKPA